MYDNNIFKAQGQTLTGCQQPASCEINLFLQRIVAITPRHIVIMLFLPAV